MTQPFSLFCIYRVQWETFAMKFFKKLMLINVLGVSAVVYVNSGRKADGG